MQTQKKQNQQRAASKNKNEEKLSVFKKVTVSADLISSGSSFHSLRLRALRLLESSAAPREQTMRLLKSPAARFPAWISRDFPSRQVKGLLQESECEEVKDGEMVSGSLKDEDGSYFGNIEDKMIKKNPRSA